MRIETLPIQGYRHERVPNRFFEQASSEHLAVILPGLNYTADMPLLYYAVSHLLNLGADVLQVEYGYGRRPEYAALPPDEQAAWLAADVTAAWHAVPTRRAYRRVTLVGKSLGTRALAHLQTIEVAPGDAGEARVVWLTPLLKEQPVRASLFQSPRSALVLIGTADPQYDPAALTELRARLQGEIVIIPDADHGLEIPGDIVRSVQALEQVMRAVQRFLA